jgi:hypothetical protein
MSYHGRATMRLPSYSLVFIVECSHQNFLRNTIWDPHNKTLVSQPHVVSLRNSPLRILSTAKVNERIPGTVTHLIPLRPLDLRHSLNFKPSE